MAWALRILLTLVILGWLGAARKIAQRRQTRRWVLGPEAQAADPALRVDVVIPARNEEANIAGCVESALAQDHPQVRVIVLNDGSTDQTGAILAELAARDPRVVVLEGGGGALPEGWYGKPWACQRAGEKADGNWVFFVDADVRLHPSAVSRVVAWGEGERLDMVTGFGTLVMESFWEKVLQPAVAGMILVGNDLDEVNDPERADKNMASGQLLAFRTSSYRALGGHAPVKSDILDDVGMARAVKGAKMRYHCLFLRELYRVRMYTSFAEVWSGWSKNLFAGMHYNWGVVAGVLLYLFISVQLGPTLALLGGLGIIDHEWALWGLAQVLVMQGVRAWMDKIWGHELVYGLTHAPATAILMAIIVNSGLKSRGKGVAWRGRVYKPGA